MTSGTKKDMVSSVRARLLNLARQTSKPFEEILVLYGLERFLFCLSQSSYKDYFLLKGGLLLMGMGFSQARPTRDIDFLGRSVSSNLEDIKNIMYTKFYHN